MYPPPPPRDESRYQAKLIVNMVVVVFLIIGLLLILQHFNFIFLKDIPVLGDWLMGLYERIFGPPHILVIHGEDSIGDWNTLRNKLAENIIFISEELDVDRIDAGMVGLLSRYSLVIVIDAKRLDKDKLLNLDNYVQSGGNLIWVADAGTKGYVEYQDRIIANQTGWYRPPMCIHEVTLTACNCSKASNASHCKFLKDPAERMEVSFQNRLGVSFVKDIVAQAPQMQIVDKKHWSVVGISRNFTMKNVDKFARVSPLYDAGLVANIVVGDENYPAIVAQDLFGSKGIVVYFAYPPYETMEILIPLVERLRY
jgi:hypothetical protein